MSLKGQVETVLFVTAKAMEVEEIAQILNKDPIDVENALLELIMDYSSKESALEIDDEDGYIIQVREEYKNIVEKLVPVEISDSVLKTLSIVAIKEPILQRDLFEIRGYNAYEHIKELLDKGLISRKRAKDGRSFLVKTTTKFTEYFKLKGDTKLLSKLVEIEKQKTPTSEEKENDEQ